MAQSEAEGGVGSKQPSKALPDWPQNMSVDDEEGNCRRCGHPFNPHLIIAYDVEDFSKGGEMRCQVEGCPCFSSLSFNLKDSGES
jgi:hypothetical protein